MARHRADRLTPAAQIAVICPCCRSRVKKIRMSAGVSSPGRRMTSASIVSVRRTGIPSSAQRRLTLSQPPSAGSTVLARDAARAAGRCRAGDRAVTDRPRVGDPAWLLIGAELVECVGLAETVAEVTEFLK